MRYTTVKRILSLVVALALCVSPLTIGAAAADGPAVSSNIDEHYYINAQRWTDPIKSTLTPEGDGFVRVECIDDVLVVEYYDRDFQYLSGKTLELELPIYGGVYMCEDYNFVVVGQNNYDEDDTVEVFRIIRYSKDWVRQASCGLFGANTIEPFQAGCVRFDRCGDYLYIRTAHKMYASDDGLNHQANVMINVRVSDMTIADSFTEVLNKNYGYISHSFNQFVRVDGTDLLAVDHGDALPRSVVLIKYNKPAGQDSFYGRVSLVNALPIVDSTYHYNDTGVSVGGFEYSSSHYLIAGNSYNGTEAIDLMYAHRNIFVTATPKDDFTDEATAVHWLTDYTAADQVDVSPPHMVKVSADRFCLIWTEDGVLKYCFVNGEGEPEGAVATGEGALSDCVPVVDGDRIVWYVTNNSAPVFYEIPIAAAHVHSYTAAVVAPTCTEAGYTVYTCSGCGDLYTADETDALGHTEETVPGYPASCTQPGLTDGSVCSACGEVLIPQEEIPALGHHFEDGICTVCNSGMILNAATGDSYTTIAAAISEAAQGQTLKLQSDWTEAEIMVTHGITLDLNGFALHANYLVAFEGAHVIDSVGTGRLVTGSQHAVLDEANAMVPVYDGEGYVFTKAGFTLGQDTKYTGDGIKIKAGAYPVNMDVVQLLKDGSADNHIQIMIQLSWDSEKGTGSQEFVFTDEVVSDVYSSNNGTWNSYGKMFSMVITGFDNIENLKANMVILSDTDVRYVSSTDISIT